MSIPVGAKGSAEMTVTPDKTAAAVGSGSLAVFATPWMVAMMELAACNALAPYYDEGQSSVGTKLEITHDAATPLDMKVCAEAEVVEVDRRRIVFQVTAWDETGVIGKGKHERFLISAEKFLAKTEAKKG
jgi:predicted thioesterase